MRPALFGVAAFLLVPVAAAAAGCREFQATNLIKAGFNAMHGAPMDTSSVQDDCRKALRANPGDRDADMQLARAQIAAAKFVDAEATLTPLDQAGVGQAIRMRGYLRDLGLIGPREFDTAQAYYDRAIAAGDIVALEQRARGYTEVSEKQDKPHVAPEAVDLLDRAVAAGYPPAMEDLASLIDHGDAPGRSAQDALRLVQAAAAAGWPPAELHLGLYYGQGIVVPLDRAKADALGTKALSFTPSPNGLPNGFGTFPPWTWNAGSSNEP